MNNQKCIKNRIREILNQTTRFEDHQRTDALKACGVACCETSWLYQAALNVRNDSPANVSFDRLFSKFKIQYYNSPRLSMENNKITLVFEECTCPLVKEGVKNPRLCNCTLGFSQKLFETLFGKEVNVTLENSVLRGNLNCKQVIWIIL